MKKKLGRLVGFASSGAKFGNIVALSLGGILCLHGMDGGWPSIFYLFGLFENFKLFLCYLNKKKKYLILLSHFKQVQWE